MWPRWIKEIECTPYLSALLKDVAVPFVVVARRSGLGEHVWHIKRWIVQLKYWKNCLIHFIDAILGFVKIGSVLNKKLSKLFYSLPSHCNLTKSFPRPFFSCSLLHCRYVYVTIHCRFTLKKILKNEWMITHTKRIGPLKSSRKFKSIFSP